MNWPVIHRRALLLIAVATVVSGAIQMVAPGFVLGTVGGEKSPASLHFFGIVGMFMVLFGAMLGQALLSKVPQPLPVFWAAMQKFGASGAVALGSCTGVFQSPLAWGVAAFDLLSGVLAIWYWKNLRNSKTL